MNSRVRIYWLTARPLADVTKRDHVMPRAFGRFTNSPILGCVCDECNAAFGVSIAREVGRDSLEALLRVYKGTKPASESHELGRSRAGR